MLDTTAVLHASFRATAEHVDGVGVRRPVRRVITWVQRFGVVVGQPGLAQHVQVGLAMQMRREVAVGPRVALLGPISTERPVGRSAAASTRPARGRRPPVVRRVELHAREPAVVLLQSEQRAGVSRTAPRVSATSHRAIACEKPQNRLSSGYVALAVPSRVVISGPQRGRQPAGLSRGAWPPRGVCHRARPGGRGARCQ